MENELTPQNQMNAAGQAMAMGRIAMIKAQMEIASTKPRDFTTVHTKVMKACSRKQLAEVAIYKYPRAGQAVSGPSIRLAEVIAQSFGNMDFGTIEISRQKTASGGFSVVESFCMDLETNVKSSKVFQVNHIRDKRSGPEQLKSDRDIYEHVANYGTRRLRACILAILPGDLVEEATQKCKQTCIGKSDTPIEDRIKAMVTHFDTKFQITSEMIEQHLKHDVKSINEDELFDLRTIAVSLTDGQSKRSDWFKFKEESQTESVTEMTDIINEESGVIDIQDNQKKDDSPVNQNVDNSVESSASEKTTSVERKPAPAKKSAAKKKSNPKKTVSKKEPASPMMQQFENEVTKTKSTK